MDFAALSVTLRLAAVTTALLMLVATPLAAWIASGPDASTTRPTVWNALRRIVQALVALPLVLPPTVLGFYLLVGLGPHTAIGRAIATLLGHTLAFSFAGLIAGSVLYSLPFAVQPLVVGFAGVDRELIATARVLGAGPWTLFRSIIVPLARRSFGTAMVLTFAHTVGEFGVVLMVGGDIPGVTKTLSVAIFDQVQEANYTAANTMAGWLVAVSFAALLAVYGKGLWGRRQAQR
jgi:molybdate transport system permease protein